MQPPATISGESESESVPSSPLILVGASVRAAARSAQIAGIPVIGIDLFGDTDTIAACQSHFRVSRFEQAAQIAENIPAMEVMQVGGFEGENGLLGTLQKRHTVLGPPHELRERLLCPDYLAALAKHSGLHFPSVRRASQTPLAPTSRGRAVLKDAGQSGGLGVRWANSSSRPDESCGFPSDGYLQDWVAGRVHGATLLCDGTRSALLGIFRSCFTRKNGCPFVYAGSRGPSILPANVTESIQRLGNRLSSDGLLGLCNVDLIVDREHRGWLLEVNPRWSGSSELIELALRASGRLGAGDSLMAWARRIARREASADSFDVADVDVGFWIKKIVYAKRTVRFDSVCLDDLRARYQRSVDIRFHDRPSQGEQIEAGSPLLTVIVTSHRESDRAKKSPSELGLVVRQCVKEINERLAYGSPRSSA